MNLSDTSYSSPTQEMIHRSTVVCVTDQRRCERLIKAGRVIADISKTGLTVISVVDPARSADPEALEFLFGVSKLHNAVMSIQYSADALRCIADFIADNKALNVVTGMREGENSILPKLWQRFSATCFFTVTQDGEYRRTAELAANAASKAAHSAPGVLPIV